MSETLPEGAPVSSDAALISRIREGDISAYGLLYERHVGAARGLARQLVSGEAEAEDAVSETFTKVLDLLRRGGGPDAGFRPYLLTAVRRTVYDRYRRERRSVTTDEIERYDPGVPFVDPALRGLEHSLIVRAFRSLPERWQAVLWHTEIEGGKPAEVAPLLGLTANGTAALAYRAREGLREAYLQMHIADGPADTCRPALDKLGAYVRGGLAKRDSSMVERHLDSCADCKAIHAELADVNTALRTGVGPLVLGTSAAGYLALAKGGGLSGWLFGWWRHLPKRQQQLLTGGTAVVAAAAVLAGLLLVGDKKPLHPPAPHPPIAAPAPRPPGKPPARPARPTGPKPPPAQPAHRVSPPPAPPAQPILVPRIGTVGTLLRSQPGIVALSVRNDGTGPSQPVVADVALPPGVGFRSAATGRTAARQIALYAPGNAWTCTAQSTAPATAVHCTHAALPAHSAASAYLHVTVGPDAPYGTVPRVALRSAGVRAATAKADSGVQDGGLPARFATDGNVRTLQAGNALLTCDPGIPTCLAAQSRQGHPRDNDLWPMVPLDLDHDPTTKTSSSARLTLPTAPCTTSGPGAGTCRDVLWAGLYWSGVDCGRGSAVKVRGPGADGYSVVRAGRVDKGRLPSYSVYQAFADVTGLVREHGGGQWWVADVPTRGGVGGYAGWSLVVVVRDASAPWQQVMVLDGDHPELPEGAAWRISLDGLLAARAPARIGVGGWEGDADLGGDRLSLDGTALTPEGGDRDPDNVFDSSAAGATGPQLTFGVDVDTFQARLGVRPSLELSTRQDAYLLGVVTVTAPMRS